MFRARPDPPLELKAAPPFAQAHAWSPLAADPPLVRVKEQRSARLARRVPPRLVKFLPLRLKVDYRDRS